MSIATRFTLGLVIGGSALVYTFKRLDGTMPANGVGLGYHGVDQRGPGLL